MREWICTDEITADTTDADIDRLAAEIERIAEEEDVVLYGRLSVSEYLAEVRDELRE
jgi:hypothetical protein